MKVSLHAGERFLQRVMVKNSYSCFNINFAIKYLEKVLQDMQNGLKGFGIGIVTTLLISALTGI